MNKEKTLTEYKFKTPGYKPIIAISDEDFLNQWEKRFDKTSSKVNELWSKIQNRVKQRAKV